jgi:hypothetical protein
MSLPTWIAWTLMRLRKVAARLFGGFADGGPLVLEFAPGQLSATSAPQEWIKDGADVVVAVVYRQGIPTGEQVKVGMNADKTIWAKRCLACSAFPALVEVEIWENPPQAVSLGMFGPWGGTRVPAIKSTPADPGNPKG